jgi:hypothetical protein
VAGHKPKKKEEEEKGGGKFSVAHQEVYDSTSSIEASI